MHDDQRIEDGGSADISEEQRDRSVIGLLLSGGSWPWTVDEIARELRAPIEAADAVSRLTEAGLLHRFGDFVFPTRAARRADELEVGAI